MLWPVNANSIAPSLVWNRTYTGNDLQSVASAFQTADGGFILAGIIPSNGSSVGLELVKIDSSGNLLWSKTYPGTAGAESNFAKWIVQTSDGGYAIAGQFEGNSWLAKLDAGGNMQWNKTYIVGAENSEANILIKTSEGGFALTGISYASNGSSSYTWIIKTDAFGNEQPNNPIFVNGPTNGVDSFIQTSDGGYAFTAHSSRMIIELGEINTDCTLTKTDSNGSEQWSQVYSDFGYGWSIVQTTDGGYVLGSGKGIALLKTDALGVIQWTQSYGPGQAWVMTETSDSGFALAGTALVKTDTEGNKQWALNFSDGDHAYTVIQTNDGGYLCAGQLTIDSGSTSWVAKINQFQVTAATSQSSSTESALITVRPTSSTSLTTSPSIPELPVSAILPLLVAMFFVSVKVRIESQKRAGKT